jgi:sialate O-acetylesterase
VDLPLDDPVHIGSEGHARLGARLARLACRLVYKTKEPPPPELDGVRRIETGRFSQINALELRFRNVVGGLRSDGAPSGFSFIDKDHRRIDTIYKTTLSGNKIMLESDLQYRGNDYRLMYGAGVTPNCNITDGRDMAIPVFGPVVVKASPDLTPYITNWLVSAILPGGKSLADWPAPTPRAKLRLQPQRFAADFVDMHEQWNAQTGQAVFFTTMDVPENMKLELRFGYDGPARIWIGDRCIHSDMKGMNPAIPDLIKKPLSLKTRRYRIAVAMDSNNGLAWGYYLRFQRRDVTAKQLRGGGVILPRFGK